jgi:FAD synthase
MTTTHIAGITKRYKGNGRKLGYPTANIDTDTNLEDGVYFGYAVLGKQDKLQALIFIGTPTTVGDTIRRVEAHILDMPDKDYYDLPLSLSIHQFHRPNKNFDSIDELLIAMKQDELAGRAWFQTRKV